MFQRQLSTTALGSSASPKQVTSSSSSKGGIPHRPFQRQATASQLFSSSASSGVQHQNDDLGNKQRMAQLLTGGGPSNQLASSTSNLSSRRSPGGDFEQVSSTELHHQQQQQLLQQKQKRPEKKKRIISRMLSISAIQTTISHSATPENSFGPNNSNSSSGNSGTANPTSSFNFSALGSTNPDTDAHHTSGTTPMQQTTRPKVLLEAQAQTQALTTIPNTSTLFADQLCLAGET